MEDVKKLCDSLRRGAKDERVLFHYNGHGVPRPTSNSEMWVFNKNFTQYIPLSVYDLQVPHRSTLCPACSPRTPFHGPQMVRAAEQSKRPATAIGAAQVVNIPGSGHVPSLRQ